MSKKESRNIIKKSIENLLEGYANILEILNNGSKTRLENISSLILGKVKAIDVIKEVKIIFQELVKLKYINKEEETMRSDLIDKKYGFEDLFGRLR